MDLSIIIVNYNTKKLTIQTIQSLIDTINNMEYEIIVSDNNSTDGSVEELISKFPQVKIIRNKDNYGFSKANNIAIRQSKGDYILLLNSDTLVMDNCIEKCLNEIKNDKEIGALGCKVLLSNGTLDHACKRGFPTPQASLFYILKLDKLFTDNKKLGQYTMGYLSEEKINEVDSLTGAFMMLGREVIDKVGLLDEEFFMYGEDIDWCYRIKKAGWRIVYYPEAQILHYKGGSSKKKRIKTIYEFHRAMLLFYNKHYLHEYNIIVTFLVYIGVGIKFILSLFSNLFKKRG